MEELKWNRLSQKPSRRGADGNRGVLSRGMHSDKCPSGYGVFLLARMDCNDNNDSGVRDRLKLF